MEHDEQPKKAPPTHYLYHERTGPDGKTYSTKLGYGYKNKGPGIEARTDFMPVNGRLTIYTAEERLEMMKKDQRPKQERGHKGHER